MPVSNGYFPYFTAHDYFKIYLKASYMGFILKVKELSL